MALSTAARPGSLNRAGLSRVLATLCVTEVTSWGVLYYAFPVLATDISAATGWPLAWLIAAFSAGQLVAALVGIPVGRVLDRHGPRAVMTAGSVLAVPAVLAIAAAPNLAWFAGAWLLAGVAMGAVLYPPAFAALTRWYGPHRVRALTVLTLAAGLASTVFAPLTAALAARLEWRQVYLVLAIVLGLITIIGHAWGLRGPWPRSDEDAQGPAGQPPGRVVRSRPFIVLVAALALTAFATFAVVINLVPLLLERGVDAGTAAVALGLGGLGQVLGRLGYAPLVRWLNVRARTVVVLAAVAITTALLGVLTSVTALIVAAVVAGMARGILTLLQATAVTDRWGATHYGQLTGILSAPLTITVALAPWAGAGIAALTGGYSPMFLVLAALALGGSALGLAATPSSTERTP
ncbi:MFS transporter [Amycolatopsis cihanbeyliensis]|uniref:Cyanate permease n=1 Tax=Amycolatopsis cihanbeyliensis TaxID=1128664 RepID=A0A542DF16_AMYCI|nr:MFS transporter [Amycolatopsis cihanbeyliensis]TQJ01678.1 cyanate permease [Amycolatopsis cihanbeyliensis]